MVTPHESLGFLSAQPTGGLPRSPSTRALLCPDVWWTLVSVGWIWTRGEATRLAARPTLPARSHVQTADLPRTEQVARIQSFSSLANNLPRVRRLQPPRRRAKRREEGWAVDE